MEYRKEYNDDEPITCPKCGSDDVDFDDAPLECGCNECGTKFQLITSAVWEE
ncbi:unnamed protein product [marine sediment metagenome]|uniref:TFIIB-type domain-containing protein n=1 Tax=marine sediment metagenome TaxID=412755 RepID=X1HSI8_9ZZZZ